MIATKRPILLIVIATIAVEVLMIVSGMGPDVWLVAAVAATIGVGIWIVVDTADTVPSVVSINAIAPQEPTHRVDRRVTRLRSGLAHGQTDSLSADQLLAGHQVDRATDPDAAAAIIGPELASFIDDPSARRSLPGTRALDRILTQIERL
jgi:uncharacterized protein YqfA (UPF0365 family)